MTLREISEYKVQLEQAQLNNDGMEV